MPYRYRPISFVSTLPSSAIDGQEIYYQASGVMAASGINWHLRYNASSSSSYKWEFIGGSPLYSQDAGPRNFASFSSDTWGTIDSATDPEVTVPLAGDYVVEHQARMAVGSGSATLFIGIRRITSSNVTTDATVTEITSTSCYETLGTGRQTPRARGLITLTAGTAVKQRYWHNVGSTQTLNREQASLSILPVRVG